MRSVRKFVLLFAAGVVVLAVGASSFGADKNGRDAGVVAAAGEAKKSDDKVAAKAFLSVDRLPAGQSCRVVMILDIEEGWNIKPNPAPENFIPTVFSIKSKHGTTLRDIRYPEGKKAAGEDVPVYEERVMLYGILDIPKDAAGETEEIEMTVRYQACKGGTCLIPKTAKLTGKLEVAPQGDVVKQINMKYFAAAAQK